MPLALAPNEAWQPLPPEAWNAPAARHLLRRAAWTATPEETRRAVADGLDATLDRLFPAHEGHAAPDLAEGQPRPDGSARAPYDFRPDPTAAVPPGEREALRPASVN